MTDSTVKSPCISLCRLNDNGICEGCYRTAEEIKHWSYLDNQQRSQVLSNCTVRAAELDAPG
ncbi:MAG: DUF1289 domain-containing protein [Porticoccaceae bacterium]